MLDVFDDQGNKGKIPVDQMQAALGRGFKPAVRVTSPDGQGGWVPNDQAKAAMDKGFKLGPPEQQPDPTTGTAYEGYARLGAGVKDALGSAAHLPGGIYHAVTDPASTPEEMASVQHGGGLSLAINRMVGKPMQAEQQKANQTTGLESAGHRVAGALPFIGPFAGQAGQAIGQDPLRGGAELGTNFLMAGAVKNAPKFISSALDSIPTKAKAGALFNEAASAANPVPVDVTAPGNTALRIQEAAGRGGSMPKVVRDFINRATKPDSKPLTYEEARDFYQNASRLSANETQRLTPNQQRMVGQFARDLGDSISGAADQAGVKPQYQGAMQQYRQASKVQKALDTTKSYATNEIVKKLPWLAAAYGAKKLFDSK